MSSTQLPLVLAITTLASSIGQMRPTTAAALVEAAVLSTLIFPIVGLRLRGRRDVDPASWPVSEIMRRQRRISEQRIPVSPARSLHDGQPSPRSHSAPQWTQ